MYQSAKPITDGINRIFAVPFPYLDKSHVKAYVDDVLVSLTFLNSSTIQLSEVPPAGSNRLSIRRETAMDNPVVVFEGLASLDPKNLDTANKQILYYNQEQQEMGTWALASAGEAKVSATEAANSAEEALQHANEAQDQAAEALVQAQACAAAQLQASDDQLIASNASIAAQQSAAAALTSATEAANSATEAANSATEAANSAEELTGYFVEGVLPVAHGGTGNDKKKFVDIDSQQTIDATKLYNSQQLFSPTGTKEAPAVAFQGDIETGMYSPAAGVMLGFAVAGRECLALDYTGKVRFGTTNNYAKLNIGDATTLVSGPLSTTTTSNQLSCVTLQAVTSGVTFNNRTVTVLNTDAGNSTQSVQSLRADIEVNGTTAGATVYSNSTIYGQLNWNSATTTSTANQLAGNFVASIYNGAPNTMIGCQGTTIYRGVATGTATLGAAVGVLATSYNNKVGSTVTVQTGISASVGQSSRAVNTITNMHGGQFDIQPGDATVGIACGVKVACNVLMGDTTNISTLYGFYIDQANLVQGAGVTTKYGIYQVDTDAPNVLNSRVDMLKGAKLSGLSVHADNASAISGGKVAGDVYRTSTGVLMVVY